MKVNQLPQNINHNSVTTSQKKSSTVWKLKKFSAILILREINLEFQKIAILVISDPLNFIFEIFKYEIPKKSKFKASKIVRMADSDLLKSTKIDFT